MSTLTYIGIQPEKAAELSDKLNELLANYSVLYINTRGYHWNISGDNFFELHAKFEELYDSLFLKIDEIAERILTLGNTPIHTYQKYLDISRVKPAENITDGKEALQNILDSFAIIIGLQRDILILSGDVGDEGTNSMMSDYIREQEKIVWMYASYLA